MGDRAASGIGRETARHFAANGYYVAIADQDTSRGSVLADELCEAGAHALFIPMDVREERSVASGVEQTVQSFSRLDTLINNAGVERYRTADQYTTADWQCIHETNLRGAFFASKYAAPHLRRSRGSIVMISSVQAFATEREISVYAATKSGLLGLARGMALDFAIDGVRVNCICPGAIQTGMMDAALENELDPEAAREAIGRRIPLGRVGQPIDIARATLFLASEEASYITGTTLVVDGGLLARLSL